MTAIVNPISNHKVLSRRCLGCRLPDGLREQIERDRIRGWATFQQLSQKLAPLGFQLSESAIRRHFRHVDRDRYFEEVESAPKAAALAPTPTPFDDLITAEAV